MSTKCINVFIVGTDTGVGKTVLCLLVMQYLYAEGYQPFYLKPFQTGCIAPDDINSDARFVYDHVEALTGKDPADSVLNCFENPKAPWFAARDMGQRAELAVFRRAVEQKQSLNSHVVIEAAGGLLVPLNEESLIVDAVKMTDCKAILVARAGLGTINQTLLSLEAMDRRGIVPAGVVFMAADSTPVPEEMIKENMEAVERFSGVKVAGVVGQIRDFSNPDQNCYEAVERFFGASLR